MRKKIFILGAGGLAREVAWLLDHPSFQEQYQTMGYAVSDPTRSSAYDSPCSGLEVLADADAVAIGIGTPSARRKVHREVASRFPHLDFPALVHPSAIFDGNSCTIAPGAIVTAGCVFTVDVHIGAFAFVNLKCTIGHESRIGAYSVLNPSVDISGGTTIGEACLVGCGARVLQYLSVGDDATVGAGAVVTKNVAAKTTVVGVPAREKSS